MILYCLFTLLVSITCLYASKNKPYTNNSDMSDENFKNKYQFNGVFSRVKGMNYPGLSGYFNGLVTTDTTSFKRNCQTIIGYFSEFYIQDSNISIVKDDFGPVDVHMFNAGHDSLRFNYSTHFHEEYKGFIIQKQLIQQPVWSSYKGDVTGYLRIQYDSISKMYYIENGFFAIKFTPPAPVYSREKAEATLEKQLQVELHSKTKENPKNISDNIHFNRQCLYVNYGDHGNLKYTFTYEFETDKSIGKEKYFVDAVTGKVIDPVSVELRPY